ncbi:MAG: HAD-IA family hydrolase [Candidatus Omnitrophota bacterium]
MENPRKTVLIFDFDGTIADTHHYIVELSNRLSKEFHYKKILPEELPELKDKTAHEIIQHLKVPLTKVPAIVSRAKKEFQKDIQALEPIKGLKEALHYLKSAGTCIGILSSNAADNIKAFLRNHDLDFFDFTHSTTSIWGKHICLNKVISQNGLKKEDVVYVGDEIRDIDAAKKLGVKVAAVTWGYNSAKALKKMNPDFLLEDPQDLLNLISPATVPSF